MDASAHREAVYEIFAASDADLDERIARALDVGADYLDLPLGFLTRIEDGTQEIVKVAGTHEGVRVGETCPLSEAYCRKTVERGGHLAVRDAAASTAVTDPAYERFGLGSYVGATVVVDGDLYGTVCFADEERRGSEFSEAETVFVELLAKLVGQAMEKRVHERELRRRNERLRAEKRRFEGIAETSFDILFRVETDATFTYVSSAVERVLGYAPEELVGDPFTAYLTEASGDDALDAYGRVMDGETVENLELDFVSAAGDTVVVEVNGTPITEDGDVVGVEGVGRDVTARKERERELRLKTRAMDEARIGITIADEGRPDTPWCT